MPDTSIRKAVLAYSGGLDTSVIVPWLRETYGCDVVCFCADVGQGGEIAGLEERARASGASQVVVRDLRDEFARDFLFPMLRAGAVYERRYLLGTAIARPLIAAWQVRVAAETGADALAHGCTGKGNDQVRFELTYKALDPTLRVIAPWREWSLRSREDALAYARSRGLDLPFSPGSLYSRDRNLWHLSHEGGPLEDPAVAPDPSLYQWTAAPEQAPAAGETVEIAFAQGVPVAVNETSLSPAALVAALNDIGARHGVGRVDLVENRLVGIKSRGVYETPGGTLLYAAHRELESLCLDRDTAHAKEAIVPRFAELIYEGKWFTPLRAALQAFVDATQESVTGTVRLHLRQGAITVAGRRSPRSLYREDLATFGAEDVYDQKEAAGFINLFGLPMKVRGMLEQRRAPGGERPAAPGPPAAYKRD